MPAPRTVPDRAENGKELRRPQKLEKWFEAIDLLLVRVFIMSLTAYGMIIFIADQISRQA